MRAGLGAVAGGWQTPQSMEKGYDLSVLPSLLVRKPEAEMKDSFSNLWDCLPHLWELETHSPAFSK